MSKISAQRKTTYYVGNAIAIIGVICFLSTFVSAASNFGNFDNFEARGQSMGLRAITGMIMIIVGAVVSNIGARGLAGSGVILDPEEAREDLKPYSHQARRHAQRYSRKSRIGQTPRRHGIATSARGHDQMPPMRFSQRRGFKILPRMWQRDLMVIALNSDRTCMSTWLVRASPAALNRLFRVSSS